MVMMMIRRMMMILMMTLSLFIQHGLSRELAEGTEWPLLCAPPAAARAGVTTGDDPL